MIASDKNSQLESWDSLRTEFSGLLVGNGASCAVWDKFRYPSLLEIAKSEGAPNRLEAADVTLFKKIRTDNFEQVLSAIATARQVNESLGLDTANILNRRYDTIRRALVKAVKDVHIPWDHVPNETLKLIRAELLHYDFVYSTNYDLLLYWAVNHKDSASSQSKEFRDYFWSAKKSFDLADTGALSNTTKLLYLHGGIHLYKTIKGQTMKRLSQNGVNLLYLFDKPMTGEATPLFVTEGTPSDKDN